MASIRILPQFKQELYNTLDYGLEIFGQTATKRFYKKYETVKNRLKVHPLSSPKEPILKNFLRPYHSALIMKNWKIIYRYDEKDDRIIFVDLWDMRRHPRTLIRQFKRKL